MVRQVYLERIGLKRHTSDDERSKRNAWYKERRRDATFEKAGGGVRTLIAGLGSPPPTH
jgi:hypothetical protein